MPKVDLPLIAESSRTGYPPPFDREVAGRRYRRLAPATGIEDFGASLVRLEPGAWSSQRHWHEGEDELLVMIEGEAMLVEDESRTLLKPGDVAAFPKGNPNGHHLINESKTDCKFLVVGGGTPMGGTYSDVDMIFTADGNYEHKDGTPYPARRV
ncbi:MAG TPA: cupin domain-containing protein [Sphingomicrobium sp.]|nr:cupin domain-containing protein [Sphingomicrobium sp.]